MVGADHETKYELAPCLWLIAGEVEELVPSILRLCKYCEDISFPASSLGMPVLVAPATGMAQLLDLTPVEVGSSSCTFHGWEPWNEKVLGRFMNTCTVYLAGSRGSL